MLLFAAAGLDSFAKQVVQDALPRLARNYPSVRAELRTFTIRRLRREDESAEGSSLNAAFLADVLMGPPWGNLVDSWKRELTGSSLQSKDELHRVAKALGVSQVPGVRDAINGLEQTFAIRNQISHEMDINFESVNRNRNSRRRNDMVARTNGLLAAADALLRAVDEGLVSCTHA